MANIGAHLLFTFELLYLFHSNLFLACPHDAQAQYFKNVRLRSYQLLYVQHFIFNALKYPTRSDVIHFEYQHEMRWMKASEILYIKEWTLVNFLNCKYALLCKWLYDASSHEQFFESVDHFFIRSLFKNFSLFNGIYMQMELLRYILWF